MRDRTAILSFHSHGDRSFLDDATLALLSGDLTRAHVENDLIVAVLDARSDDARAAQAFSELVRVLEGYSVVVFERVWNRDVVQALRDRLPHRTFVSCSGEHELEDPPADYLCRGEFREVVPALVAFLGGERSALPPGVFARGPRGFDLPSIGREAPLSIRLRPKAELPWEPNLRPLLVNPEALPTIRTFSLEGNHGCPYQTDARENPLYAGIEIPAGSGRGCAFCVTGNEYTAQAPSVTAADVLGQLRYVRRHAPELSLLVLKDQNPFAYLSELIESCGAEGLGGFTLLLETRADWFLRSEHRFERALDAARRHDIKISPFLVGIENFSQAELDRFNKGTTSEALIQFVKVLWRWREEFGDTFDLSHASFGFILLSPWTRLADIKLNYEAVKATQLDRLRGSLLVSRARLYPDTALYYLAKRDGLLADEYASDEEDSARRYGYFPPHPWRFAEPDVAHFASVAADLHQLTEGRDQVRVWGCLLDAFDGASHFADVDAASVLSALRRQSGAKAADQAGASATEQVSTDLRVLLAPVAREGELPPGWRAGDLRAAGSACRFRLEHAAEPAIEVEVRPATEGPCFDRSRNFSILYLGRSLNQAQERALRTVCAIVARGDA